MTLVCKINLVFIALVCGTSMGQAIEVDQYFNGAILYPIVLLLANMLIEGLLRLHVTMSDPFGDDECDFPWEMMMAKMDEDVQNLENQFNNMPFDFEKMPSEDKPIDSKLTSDFQPQTEREDS